MKKHGNQKYPPELLAKAVKKYNQGKLSLIDVCEEFGIGSTTTLRYHASKAARDKIKQSYKKWRSKNLESNRQKMRDYVKKKKELQ